MNQLLKLGVRSHFLGLPGLSSPLDEVWTLQDYVDWVVNQLPANKKVILVGHSFGGQIAIRLAAQQPNRLKQLILIDSGGIRDHSLPAVVKRKAFWVAAKLGKLLFNFNWAKKLLYKLARERDYTTAPPLMKRTMSIILDDEVLADLPQIAVPTLLLWGQEDTVTPLKTGIQMDSLLIDSQLKIIPEARHSPQFTHVADVAASIAAFVYGRPI